MNKLRVSSEGLEDVIEMRGKMKNRKDQEKFYVDLRKDKKSLKIARDLIVKANNKNLGKEVSFTDIVTYSLTKLSDKDIETIQDQSLDEMDRVKKHLEIYNQKNGSNLDLGEFLVTKLKI